jgi:hypothetical protein
MKIKIVLLQLLLLQILNEILNGYLKNIVL